MKRLLWLVCLFFVALSVTGQSFEISGLNDNYKGLIGETIKAPIRLKNISDKTITLVIRRQNVQIGSTQKNYYCIDNNCLDQKIDDYQLKLEADQTISALHIALDAGLAHGQSSIKYLVFNKTNPADALEFELNFFVEEKAAKEFVYSSRHIIIYEVYPNPLIDYAFMDYKVLDEQVKAKIVIHNILGNPTDEYSLPSSENQVKIRAESMNAGIYFYTLYLDNEGVVTRKLIVKK